MWFSAPRSPSVSPSPSRRTIGRRSTFGLQPSSDEEPDSGESEESYSDSESDTTSTTSSSSGSYEYSRSISASPHALVPTRRKTRNTAEKRYIDETVAAIRLRTHHQDPYEQWERATRREAFRVARRESLTTKSKGVSEQARINEIEQQKLSAMHKHQMTEVETLLQRFKLQQQTDEQRLRETFKARDRALWERIESVIKLEEDKVQKRLDEERRIREEEERKKREEESKRRQEEEKRLQEEEKKRKEEEEAKRVIEEAKRQEEEEHRRAVEEENSRKERQNAEAAQRKQIGLTSADEDWAKARSDLHTLKTQSIQVVKANKELKSEWGKWRRQITPKIGQITNDEEAITRISTQLINVVRPNNAPPHNPAIYAALLSSLAKAIIAQAETEVTAEKRSAEPLARVTFILLDTLDSFPEIFFARFVQRTGGWPIPIIIPPEKDFDGRPWQNDAERIKAMGYRQTSEDGDAKSNDLTVENIGDYTARVAGIMRVYFHILKITPTRQPMKPMFQLPRVWVWFARLMDSRGLLQSPVAPQLISTALDVLGSELKEVWGHQWIKMLALAYESVTTGMGNDVLIGGTSNEAKAARVRVQIEVERIMRGT